MAIDLIVLVLQLYLPPELACNIVDLLGAEQEAVVGPPSVGVDSASGTQIDRALLRVMSLTDS